ncbi:MAG TPA: GNAT family N-acetyltransferase [Acidimicrobiales bacterium]|jgi:putative acetyltransferase|nr:GNAT family N-acetyltransferase [Acidimicrobiales bacterium]
MLEIRIDDLSGPAIAQFLEDHISEVREVTPLQSKHALDLEALRGPEVTFWSVLDGETVVGCGAIKALDTEHAEIKAMRTAAAYQRRGVASTLLRHIMAEAQRLGFKRLSLETGSFTFFQPARQLYLKQGFQYCEPFADYKKDPNSVHMTRRI